MKARYTHGGRPEIVNATTSLVAPRALRAGRGGLQRPRYIRAPHKQHMVAATFPRRTRDCPLSSTNTLIPPIRGHNSFGPELTQLLTHVIRWTTRPCWHTLTNQSSPCGSQTFVSTCATIRPASHPRMQALASCMQAIDSWNTQTNYGPPANIALGAVTGADFLYWANDAAELLEWTRGLHGDE